MMWRTYKIYAGIYDETESIEPRFKKNVADWPVFDRIAGYMPVRIMWVAAYIAFYVAFAPTAWLYLLIPIHILMGPIHGAVINWFAHKYGYRNFKLKNTAENLLVVDVLMLGESYHNNHHKNPSSVNFGFRWHEVDPVYYVIKALNAMGVIKINKKVPLAVLSHSGELHVEDLEAVEEF